MVVSDADFQFLFADDVFLWPVRVVFPLKDNDRERVSRFSSGEWGREVVLVTNDLLDDLALLDDTLQLFHDERADPHWLTARDVGTTRSKRF